MKVKRSTVIVGVVVLVAVVALLLALISAIGSALQSIPTPVVLTNQTISVGLVNQSYLFYSNGGSIVPYVLMDYSTQNVTSLYFNVTLLKNPPPRAVFILNASGECYDCANITGLTEMVRRDLVAYGLAANESGITILQPTGVLNVTPYSELIIMNGLLPEELFQRVGTTKESVLQHLLKEGVSIVYVGGNLNNTVRVGEEGLTFPVSLVLSQNGADPSIQGYLDVCSGCVNQSAIANNSKGFSMRNDSYNFYFIGNRSGLTPLLYGPVTYKNILNGSLVAFPNYPMLMDGGNQTAAALDIARAASMMFWLPKEAGGENSAQLPAGNVSGRVGIILNSPSIPFHGSISNGSIESSYGRIVAYTNSSYRIGTESDIYAYLYYTPQVVSGGSITLPAKVIPGQLTAMSITIFTNSVKSGVVEPYINIYNQSGDFISAITTGYINKTAGSRNISFNKQVQLFLKPGNYIAELYSSTRQEYAASLFSVDPVVLVPLYINFSDNSYRFKVSVDGQPLSSGINFSANINGGYPVNGILSNANGTIDYSSPAPTILGSVVFNLSMLGGTFNYSMQHNVPPLFNSQAQELLEAGVMGLVMLMIIVLVRAPKRDDFYIDVPTVTEQKKVQITVPADDVVGVFDKLNQYFHWKYMPLSKSEFRVGISTNIKYQGGTVNATYENMEDILDRLVQLKKVTELDGLYAPSGWLAGSGHDMKYLTTFKKLRVFMVSKAHLFTDLDVSDLADMVATVRGASVYLVIYSKTSRFTRMPLYKDSKTYLAFLNNDDLLDFKDSLYGIGDNESIRLKMHIEAGRVLLLDADRPEEALS